MGEHAGAAVEVVGRQGLREDLARAGAGQRRLQGRHRRCRPLDQLSPRARLVGQGPLDDPRPQQLRRHPLRLLSRQQHRLRGVQGGRDRHPPRELRPQLDDRATTICRRSRTAASCAPRSRHENADADAGLHLQPAPRPVQGPPGARGDRPRVRLRMAEQEPELRLLHPHALLLRQLASSRPRACPRPRSSRSSSRSRARFPTRSSPPSSIRPRATARATSASRCARPSRC